MRAISYAILFLVGVLFYGCSDRQENLPQINNEEIRKFTEKVTEVMVHDITNPPLAARFFAYTFLAGYEVISQSDTTYKSMSGVLNNYPVIEKPKIEGYDVSLTALLAMIETAKKLQPSGNLIEAYQNNLLDSCLKLGYTAKQIEKSIAYAEEVSKDLLDYAKSDGYDETTVFSRYMPIDKEGHWYPTPPAYFAALEPHFNKVRPLAMDSAAQFPPAAPAPFSTDTNSPFYKMMVEVYHEGLELSAEQRNIASFWDCNPFAMQNMGHLIVGLKKISPGAHWMGITGIACVKAQKTFSESIKVHTIVAIGLLDAFISCWDEKYRSNRIRPETAIRKYIDSSWEPLLQTPPFPEYSSGHSTISGASAYILTHYLGHDFYFTDDVEVTYGLPSRDFSSFMEAAKEAAISRLYGGIHFRDANENGTAQGIKVGKWVIHTIEKIEINNLKNIEQSKI
jgi:hypothetical protein